MKRDRPAYVYQYGRQGYLYFTYPRGAKPIRIKSDLGTVEFAREYAVLLAQAKSGKRPPPSKFTMQSLVEHYQTSDRWTALKPRTQADYKKVLDWWIDAAGGADPRRIQRKHIIDAMETNAKTSVRFARYIVEVSSILFEHAIDIGWRKTGDNPAKGVRKVKTPHAKKLNRKPWPREKIDAFRAAYDLNTRERLLLELGLGTGQRAADILAMEWGHVEGADIRVKQDKTEKELLIPLTDSLRECLAVHRATNARSTRPCVYILTNERRTGPWSYRGASQAFRKAREAIGALDYDIHSMRHARRHRIARGPDATRR